MELPFALRPSGAAIKLGSHGGAADFLGRHQVAPPDHVAATVRTPISLMRIELLDQLFQLEKKRVVLISQDDP
jgi:hypothetical protein